jgi:hypothetical protein
MNLLKALIPGALLSWLVSSAIGSQGSRGAWLMIERLHYEQHTIYWSWPLFLLGAGITWILLSITPR